MELDFLVFPQNYPGFPTQEAGAGPGPTVPFVFGVRHFSPFSIHLFVFASFHFLTC